MANGIDDRHISLGLVFHNHQPVGNDEAVTERAFRESYEPQVAALERHSQVSAATVAGSKRTTSAL